MEAKVTYEDKKAEAIERLNLLEVPKVLIRDFAKFGIPPVTIYHPDGAYGFDEHFDERIREFEEKHNALVYYVIFSFTSFGDMESFLFVSDYKDEWPMDLDDLHEGYAMTWTENLTYPLCSEFGTISFARNADGELIRTA